jgi:hypothetical protein
MSAMICEEGEEKRENEKIVGRIKGGVRWDEKCIGSTVLLLAPTVSSTLNSVEGKHIFIVWQSEWSRGVAW